MQYVISYVNPSHSHRCDHQQIYTSKTQVNTFVRKARKYPGSLSIETIAKITNKGTEWLSW